MFWIFKKKKIVPHVRLSGVIGSAGRFRQGMDLSGQQEILKKLRNDKTEQKDGKIKYNPKVLEPLYLDFISKWAQQF